MTHRALNNNTGARMPDTAKSLTELLDTVSTAAEGDTVTVGDVVDTMGERSFAAVLLIPALIMVSPLSGIPGSPTVAGSLYALICVQMLLGRNSLWLRDYCAACGCAPVAWKKRWTGCADLQAGSIRSSGPG